MKGPLIGYGCSLTTPPTLPNTSLPSREWLWQPYADLEMWWNHQFAVSVSFPLLFGGIDTPEYLVLVLAAGKTDDYDQQTHPSLQMLGNFVIPLDHLTASLSERLSPPILRQAEIIWAKVVAQAKARSLALEERATLLFIYEQDLCEEP